MKLEVLNKLPEGNLTPDVYRLEVTALRMTATHLFLASNIWDDMYIELSEDIPLNMLKYMSKQAKQIRVSLPAETTEHILKLMCELYPEKAGVLRKAYMLKRDLKGALNNG